MSSCIVEKDYLTVADLHTGYFACSADLIVPYRCYICDNILDMCFGILQGTDGNTFNLRACDEGSVSGIGRGEYSVDLQTSRLSPNQVAFGNYSIVGGGQNNKASGDYSAVNGGQNNRATNEWSTVGGGLNNLASGDRSVVGGGWLARATGDHSTVAGGKCVIASGVISTIAGGHVQRATGPFSFIGGGHGNTATARYSTIVGGYENFVSGLHSFIGAGDNNIIFGNRAVVGGGKCNTILATAEYATIAGGLSALAQFHGQQAYSSGSFQVPGDAQTSTYILRNQTTDDTSTQLFLDGNDKLLKLPDNSTWTFEVHVVARRTDAPDESAGYKIEGVIDRHAGLVNLVGVPTITTLGEDSPAWSVEAFADTVRSPPNRGLGIRVTGEIGKNINWVARVETVEVIG